MNMNKDFFRALEALGEENSVETDLLIEKVKSAMLKAARRAYPHSEERITVEIDPKTKKFEMYIRQDIIDDEPIDENEVNIDVARTMDPNAMVGGTIMKELDISKLGRMAALSAKQSIKGDLREINREQMLSKFEQKEHECITAKVSQVEPGRGTVTVVYDGTELYLFRNEQIPGENLEEGKMVKVYITGIIGKNKKPVVKISRTHKDLVKRLFEQEVPEIYDGTVEVKSISREAGSRTKIAVWSKDENVDAVGACIGPKRSRITAVVNELNGEKIDIIPWSEVPEEFIARALAPAEVLKTVITSMEEKACTVIVPNNQLSLAIGNKGQNAKLAAKLTGFKIDIKPQFDTVTNEEAPELSPDFVAPVFEAVPPTEDIEDAIESDETVAETADAEAEEITEAPANEE
ncbi:transcription termination factor NusA [Ruminococcus sp.]|uniref:transcription termination factor NusA n=1 Tax=Ruminococcus sp. TaxID=41978 RepID=UPI0025FB30C8|nr:transcription termination factor NusA [Ruminococcus sp.]